MNVHVCERACAGSHIHGRTQRMGKYLETMLQNNTSLTESSFGCTSITAKHNQEPGGQKYFSK